MLLRGERCTVILRFQILRRLGGTGWRRTKERRSWRPIRLPCHAIHIDHHHADTEVIHQEHTRATGRRSINR